MVSMALVTADEYAESVATVTDEQRTFAERAKALGYSHLHQRIREKDEAEHSMLELVAIMREHDIRFYRPEDVQRYMDEQADRATRTRILKMRDSDLEARWNTTALSQYRKEVPIEALERAMQLKETANVRFAVDELVVTRTFRETRTWDPLLFVEHVGPRGSTGARLCIAVWDEPQFNAPLSA